MKKNIKLKWVLVAFTMLIFTGEVRSSNEQSTDKEVDHVSEVVDSTIFSESVSINTFMVIGNTYIQTFEATTSILASINKAVEDAHIDFVIMVGEDHRCYCRSV